MKKARMFVLVCAILMLVSAYASAVVTISGDTTALPWDSTMSVYIGNTAVGTFVSDAASDVLVSRYTYLGYASGGNGTVSMSGGSTLTTYMYNLGQSVGTTGYTTLNGAGTKITVNREGTAYGSLTVGRRGSSTLEVKTGADIEVADALTLCSYYSMTATVTVDGAGSTLTTGNYMTIGGNSTNVPTGGTKAQAYVNVTNGGSMICNEIATGVNIGYGTAARNQATALVDGEGSVWSAAGAFTVGRYGNGKLTITNGGLVKVGGVLSMNTLGGTAALIQMDSEGKLALKDAGNMGSTSISAFIGLIGGASQDIKYWNGSAYDTILNATAGVDYNIAHFTTGEFANYTVLTVPEPATMALLGIGMLSLLVKRNRKS